MRILKNNSVALMIDIQEKLFPHMAEGEALLHNSQRLIEGIKALGLTILVTEQYRKGLGLTIPALAQQIPSVTSVEKAAFSCCDEPEFMKQLSTCGKKNVILFGIEAHVCVLQTVLDLISAGYQPVVVADCTSSRKLSDKEIAMKRMRREGAIMTTYESILFELCRVSGTDSFKAISKIVK